MSRHLLVVTLNRHCHLPMIKLFSWSWEQTLWGSENSRRLICNSGERFTKDPGIYVAYISLTADNLIVSSIQLVTKYGFKKLHNIPVSSPRWQATFALDGKSLYVSRDFYPNLKYEKISLSGKTIKRIANSKYAQVLYFDSVCDTLDCQNIAWWEIHRVYGIFAYLCTPLQPIKSSFIECKTKSVDSRFLSFFMYLRSSHRSPESIHRWRILHWMGRWQQFFILDDGWENSPIFCNKKARLYFLCLWVKFPNVFPTVSLKMSWKFKTCRFP